MSLKPFYNEQAVVVGDTTLRLVINFRAIDAVESLTGKDFDSILGQLLNNRKPPLSLQAKLVWGLLREHHAEVTLDEALGLTRGEVGETIGLALAELIQAAFPPAEEKAKGKGPRKPRGA